MRKFIVLSIGTQNSILHQLIFKVKNYRVFIYLKYQLITKTISENWRRQITTLDILKFLKIEFYGNYEKAIELVIK